MLVAFSGVKGGEKSEDYDNARGKNLLTERGCRKVNVIQRVNLTRGGDILILFTYIVTIITLS